MKDIVIIGGGAAGLMAALFAAKNGARPMIAERNEKLGKKIYITGKGRCNLTNTASGEEFLRHVMRNPRFLYAALANLSSEETIDLFHALNMPTVVERGNRVYPASMKASDVTRALEKEIVRLGGKILLDARVEAIETLDACVTGVRYANGRRFPCETVILATGGLSYPSTGSTGDGYRIARELGHTIQPTRPALVAIETAQAWPGRLSGLTLKNVELCVRAGKKKLFLERGELLFTHTGISGPLGLKLSSVLPETCAGMEMTLDCKPALDRETLDARLLRDFMESSNKAIGNALDALLPHSLAEALLSVADIAPGRIVHSITREERTRIGALMKALPMTISRLRGFDEAVVTRGGVTVREIDASTMQSKRVKGLYFAGEIIDVDALTGGYNLQIAFSTGALAGKCAALS